MASACGGGDDDGTTTSTGGTSQTTASVTTIASGPTSTSAGGTATTAPSAGDRDAVLEVAVNFLRSISYSFDSRLYRGNNESFWAYQLYAPLVTVDPTTLEFTPYLAESFEVVDPQTLEVTLRPEARFHDGRPVTSEDAKVSLETLRDNQSAGVSNVNASILNVESVEVVDDRTYLVHFSRPAVLTMYELMVGPEMLIAPADAGAEQATAPIGNGRYRFVSHDQDQKLVVERWDDFFDAESTPYAGMEFVNLAEGPPQVNALLAGDVDVATDVGTEGYGALQNNPDARAHAVLNDTRYSYVVFCGREGHFWESPELRLAAKVGTDRDQLNEALYGGHGASLNQFWPAGHPYHDDALDTEYAYDPDRARELREQAGVAEGATDGLYAPAALPESQDVGLLLDDQWSDWGLGLEVHLTDDLFGSFSAAATEPPYTLEDGNSAMVENSRGGLQRLTRQLDLNSVVNTCDYENPRMSEIASEVAGLAPDDPAAAALWKEASRIAIEDGWFMILNQKPSFVGTSARIEGIDPQDDFLGATQGSFQYNDWYVTSG